MMKKNLLLIGGGAAGHQIAHDVAALFDVTLIDPKTYWEVPMALPRLLADPASLRARMAFRDFLQNVHHIQGRATNIDRTTVTVERGSTTEVVDFDYAVIATGSRYVHPLIKAEAATEEERRREIDAAHEEFKRARSVVIAGGGPVGVEIAAELRERFPHLAVTLVHSGHVLLETAPGKFPGWAADALASLRISLILGDRVEGPPAGEQPHDGLVRLRSGHSLEADVVVWAAGTAPMTGFVRDSWPSLVEENGLLKVDEYLRLQGHPNIFVAGDVTNLPEGRLALVASYHAASVVANLKAIAKADSIEAAKLKPYAPTIPGKGKGKMMIVSLGQSDGLTSTPLGQVRASFMARMIKSRDMFVPRYRKLVGLAA